MVLISRAFGNLPSSLRVPLFSSSNVLYVRVWYVTVSNIGNGVYKDGVVIIVKQ
jgi:hypothetical protein